ncbi:MAG: SBBP repeat-containing protein [Acidobacteria bacterium]|nr:SBBP repeat-containing protein [Acidobacteriota bacterium]
MIKRSVFSIFAIILAVVLLASYYMLTKKHSTLTNQTSKTKELNTQNKAKLIQAYKKTPLSFEENLGQTNSEVKFLSRGNGYNLFLTPNKATLSLKKSNKSKENSNQTLAIQMSVLGAKSNANLIGEEELAKSNYFIGNDPGKWKNSITNYKQVRYQEIYDGIDLVYYGNQQELEYDFIVKAGAKPNTIKLGFDGADKITIDSNGNLILTIEDEELIQHKPIIYQTVNGNKQTIEGNYLILDNNQVAFQVNSYDKSKDLIIDPVLAYSTYLGGNSIDFMADIAVDTDGNVYVTGETQSPNYPLTSGVLDNSLSGASAAFVTKLDSTGTKLMYSTYLGGGADNNDAARSIAIDSQGNAYITGVTSSESFPVTSGAIQTALRGTTDSFIAKLNPTGTSLVYATYLGGTNLDNVTSISVDSTGNAYIVGGTQSIDFPVTSGVFQPRYGGSGQDAFAAKIDSSGTNLLYATYLGGTGNEGALDVAVDLEGNAYIVGSTSSMDFPTTEGSFQRTFVGGSVDGFVTKLNSRGSALVYSTFLGGTNTETLIGADSVNSIALDSKGNAYLVGDTSSMNFPTTEGSFKATFPGNLTNNAANSAFVTKLNAMGTGLEYSTFLGGDTFDSAVTVIVDPMNRAYIFGNTSSSNFPVTQDAIQTKSAGELDVFVTQLSDTGKELVYSTLLGGSSSELAVGLTLDKDGNIYLAGVTTSDNYPTSVRAFQTKFDSVIDGFVSRMSEKPLPPVGMPMATISTTSLTFAKQKIGSTSAPMTVMISSRGTAPLSISKIMTTGDYAATSACANAPIDPGKDCAINVTFTPTGTKVRTGTLVIMDDAEGSPRTVSLTGKAKK